VLAIGRRGTPRKLEVPGEERSKVAYSLREPDAWASLQVLVVGGGDSALEAAMSLADVPGTEVTLSYRGDTLFRAKPKNQTRFADAVAAGRVRALMSSEVVSINPGEVVMTQAGQVFRLPNDQVFVLVGGILPTGVLAEAGIAMERKFGTR